MKNMKEFKTSKKKMKGLIDMNKAAMTVENCIVSIESMTKLDEIIIVYALSSKSNIEYRTLQFYNLDSIPDRIKACIVNRFEFSKVSDKSVLKLYLESLFELDIKAACGDSPSEAEIFEYLNEKDVLVNAKSISIIRCAISTLSSLNKIGIKSIDGLSILEYMRYMNFYYVNRKFINAFFSSKYFILEGSGNIENITGYRISSKYNINGSDVSRHILNFIIFISDGINSSYSNKRYLDILDNIVTNMTRIMPDKEILTIIECFLIDLHRNCYLLEVQRMIDMIEICNL